jgi:hypothetical protein
MDADHVSRMIDSPIFAILAKETGLNVPTASIGLSTSGTTVDLKKFKANLFLVYR